MAKRSKKRMVLICIALVFVALILYLITPFSPVKNEYWNRVKNLTEEYKLPKNKITEDDLKKLPETLQKYFIRNGYIGIESASLVIFDFKDVDFSMGVNKPNIKMDYIAYDFVKEPTRIALIDSRMFGIPFQGIDTNMNGKGTMKGVIAKHITIFDTKFDLIDATYLSECLMHPSLALQDNISYKQIDEYSVEATIKKYGQETRGIYYFNENYEMKSFIVEKRLCSETNTYEKWSAIVADYKIVNGINMPTKFQAVWNYQDGDLIYFDSNKMDISYE